MSAALSIVSSAEEDLKRDSRTCTDAENLARHIISRMESVTAKLKSLEDDIRRLWLEFDKLKAGETILGCATKKEFCERKLQRTPRAVRYMLDGGNDNRGETISPAPLCGYCHSLWGKNPICHACSPDIYRAGTNGVTPEWSDTFPSQVKFGDVLFCMKGKTVPHLTTVCKVTPRRIQVSGDGSPEGVHGNDGFPVNTLKCWDLTAIRIATEDDKQQVAEYESKNSASEEPEPKEPVERSQHAVKADQPVPSVPAEPTPAPLSRDEAMQGAAQDAEKRHTLCDELKERVRFLEMSSIAAHECQKQWAQGKGIGVCAGGRQHGFGLTRIREKAKDIPVRHSITANETGPYGFVVHISGVRECEILSLLKFQEDQRRKSKIPTPTKTKPARKKVSR